MIFNEIYSVYYNVVAKILKLALNDNIDEKMMYDLITKEAFSESFLVIIDALKNRWPLLDEDLIPIINNEPDIPLSIIEKRWLKSIVDDPRIKLFNINFDSLNDIKPLFTKDDYKIFDKNLDGDNYDDKTYIKIFNTLLNAIKKQEAIEIKYINNGKYSRIRFMPVGLEYSIKDDKFRVITSRCKYKYFNLSKIINCKIIDINKINNLSTNEDDINEVTIEILDDRNTLERAMLHFAHFEKQLNKIEDNKYIMILKYYAYDEIELVIRVLSFGPLIKVLGPSRFVKLIKERLISQMNNLKRY